MRSITGLSFKALTVRVKEVLAAIAGKGVPKSVKVSKISTGPF